MFASLVEFKQELLTLDQDVSDAERIERIRQFEEVTSFVAAMQVREVVAYAASQRTVRALHDKVRVVRSIAAEVGLARRISPHAATRYVRQAEALISDLPQTFEKLVDGAVPSWRALTVAKETGWLSPAHRREVDSVIAPQIETLGMRRLVDTVKKAAYRLDAHGYMTRRAIAVSERHVSIRPVADAMVCLSTVVPLPQGVAAYAALRARATAQVAVPGEVRTQSNIMADTFIERVTGQADASAVPIEVNVIMTDQTLLNYGDGSNEPAVISGGGVIPAELVRRAVDRSSKVLLRKLYADKYGRLAALESDTRCFTPAQRKFLMVRDQCCRTPWCEAPIRHADHVEPHDSGGATTVDNGQGLCEACNYAKTEPGWIQYRRGDEIITITPSGKRYRTRAPDLPEKFDRSKHRGHGDLNDDARGVDTRLPIAS